jgi:hypothetical protein
MICRPSHGGLRNCCTEGRPSRWTAAPSTRRSSQCASPLTSKPEPGTRSSTQARGPAAQDVPFHPRLPNLGRRGKGPDTLARSHATSRAPELERFLRGESPPDECRLIVRHLLTSCPECVAVIRRSGALPDDLLPSFQAFEEASGETRAGPISNPWRGLSSSARASWSSTRALPHWIRKTCSRRSTAPCDGRRPCWSSPIPETLQI